MANQLEFGKTSDERLVNDWEMLTEERTEDFETRQQKRQQISQTVEKLRGAIDLEAIAMSSDPENFLNAKRADEAELENLKNQIIDIDDEIKNVYESKEKRQLLSDELFTHRNKTSSKLKHFFHIKDKTAEALQDQINNLEMTDPWRLEAQKEYLNNQIQDFVPRRTNEALSAAETPLTPKEKEELLNFDALSELSTDEYLRLWRRLNPYFVSHVTRQGIRDHTGITEHTTGMGEFHNGFKEIIRDGKLNSPSIVSEGVSASGKIDREKVSKRIGQALEQDFYKDKLKAQDFDGIVNYLSMNYDGGTTNDAWSNRTAVHFAQNDILDDIYGGENGNEAFFIFPTDVIASQCLFDKNLTKDPHERKWNDLFVWPEDGSIPVDAGIAFLPKNTMVDPETGSIYACKKTFENGEEKFTLEKDEEKIGSFLEWVREANFDDNNTNQNINDLAELLDIGIKEAQDFYHPCLGAFRNIQSGNHLDNIYYLSKEEVGKMSTAEKQESIARHYLDEYQLDYKKAKKTIRAEDYWETYFNDHPDERPKHLIYYDGTPQNAVRDVLSRNHIFGRGRDTAGRDGEALGFDDHFVKNPGDDPRLRRGRQEYNALAKQLISEYYQKDIAAQSNT